MRKARIFTVILFGVFCVGVGAIAEEITLTTYYPAPYGAYEELDVSGKTTTGTFEVTGNRSDWGVDDANHHWLRLEDNLVLGLISTGDVTVQNNLRVQNVASIDGKLGIGMVPVYQLDIVGSMRLTGGILDTGCPISAGGANLEINNDGLIYKVASSLRYKHDIEEYYIESEKINKLKPVKFRWNENTANPNKEDFGLIAEEVYEIFPELVTLMDGQPESVNYAKLSVILLKNIQELNIRVKDLQDEIEKLKK